MTYLQLYHKFKALPPTKQVEVVDFIEFLNTRNELEKKAKETTRKTPVFGSARGQFSMSPDFDAPLDDFADYM